MEDRSEVIFQRIPSVSKEIIKDAVSSDGDHGSKDNVIIILPLELVTDGIVSSIHLNKFIVSLFVPWIGLRMILQGKFPVGLFDLIEGSFSADSQDLVGSVERVGIMFVEKLLFTLVDDSFLIEEPIES